MKHSPLRKSFSLRTLVQSFVFSTILFAIAACFHWRSLDLDARVDFSDYAFMFVFLLLFGLLQWIVQKNTLHHLISASPVSQKHTSAVSPPTRETGVDREKRKNEKKRLFLHLFSVLQREGRLMDFLQEDLTHYEDAQIGAAVRNIHENCKKTVKRYLSPEPIIKQDEGQTVVIEAGFDRRSIKLVGNVIGEPPFTGILRHRGWQISHLALPKLSESENPNFIAPAEIEIR